MSKNGTEAVGGGDRIAIGIPTFRRPAQLRTLLGGIALQECAGAVTVFVCDNDCDPAIKALLQTFGQGLDVRYLKEPIRGVSQVRNTIVDAACSALVDMRWLVMVDDDGQVGSGWLRTLIAAGERFHADLVGGPVDGALPAGAGLLARNSMLAARDRWPTGPVKMLNTTQNLAMSRKLLDRLPRPLFDLRYGASGGEDYDLFRRVAKLGGKLVWCDEAVVTEPPPPDRLAPRALLQRAFSTGIYLSHIDRSHDGWGQAALVGGKGAARSVIDTVAGGVTGNADRWARGLLALAHYSGRLSGLAGGRSRRYIEEGS